VEYPADEKKGIKKDEFISAFTQWAKLNKVKLNELTPENSMLTRKKRMKKLLESRLDIVDGRYDDEAGDRRRGFVDIELSELGQKLLNSKL